MPCESTRLDNVPVKFVEIADGREFGPRDVRQWMEV